MTPHDAASEPARPAAGPEGSGTRYPAAPPAAADAQTTPYAGPAADPRPPLPTGARAARTRDGPNYPDRGAGGEGPGLPRRFGNYLLLEKIAEGGMGVVYRARQQSPDRLVALKMIRPGEMVGEEDVRRFRQEADQAGGLDHPHIVP